MSAQLLALSAAACAMMRPSQAASAAPEPATAPPSPRAPGYGAARRAAAPGERPTGLTLVRGSGAGTGYAGIRLTDVIGTLSYALDMSEGQPVGHSVRTAMLGMRIGSLLGLPDEDRSALFYALLLKDLGGSSNAAQLSSLFGGDDRALKAARRLIDWTDRGDAARFAFSRALKGRSRFARSWQTLGRWRSPGDAERAMAATRAERGAVIAAMLAMPKATCDAIRATEEHWDGNGMPCGVRGDTIPVLARIVGLAQTVEVFEQAFGVRTAYDIAHARRGRWFDPVLVDVLDTFADDATFWGELRDADALPALRSCEPPTRVVYANELRLDTIAEAFARVIDAKSPFTARHSQNVSFLATRTAMELDMTSREVRALRRAALLHDIGKLGVSSNILDKPSALTATEMAEMKRHTRFTLEILKGVPRFERFAMLAASHHERLDGSGYHIGLAGDELGLSARVLAAADVCEALSGDRPYRAAMSIDATLKRLHELVAAGTLCPVAVEALSGWFTGLPTGPVHLTAGGDSTSLFGA
jgi:putative nucleotidyltransferase with HDIG domain